MPDDSVAFTQQEVRGTDRGGSATTTAAAASTRTCSSLQDEHGNFVLSNMDCLSIPVQDLRYILAFCPGLRKKKKDNPLASRLFNLKLDLKDA